MAETGTRVWFVPEAVTYDEAPTSVLVSLRQRRRWSSGVMDVAQARLGSLACGVFDEGGLRALDMLLMLTQPFCQAASFFLGCALVLVQPNAAQTIALLPLGFAGGFFAMTMFACLLSKIQGGRYNWRAILLFPLFMASWLPLNLVSLLFRTRVWREIEHGKPAIPAVKRQPFQKAEF